MSLWGLFFLRSQRWPCILNLARKLSAVLLISTPGAVHEEKGSSRSRSGDEEGADGQNTSMHLRNYSKSFKIAKIKSTQWKSTVEHCPRSAVGLYLDAHVCRHACTCHSEKPCIHLETIVTCKWTLKTYSSGGKRT